MIRGDKILFQGYELIGSDDQNAPVVKQDGQCKLWQSPLRNWRIRRAKRRVQESVREGILRDNSIGLLPHPQRMMHLRNIARTLASEKT